VWTNGSAAEQPLKPASIFTNFSGADFVVRVHEIASAGWADWGHSGMEVFRESSYENAPGAPRATESHRLAGADWGHSGLEVFRESSYENVPGAPRATESRRLAGADWGHSGLEVFRESSYENAPGAPRAFTCNSNKTSLSFPLRN